MKKLALAVAVPLALFGAATFYTSTQVESTARDAVDQANLKLREMGVGAGAEVGLTLLSFERGLLSSTARYQIDIEVADDEGNTEHYALLLQDRLEHGPFPVSRLSRGQLMPVAAQSHFELERTPLTQKLFDAASGEVPLVGDVTIGYDGGQAGDLRTAALNIEDEDGSVRIAPANLNFEANKDGSDVRMDGELAEVDIDLQRSDSGQPVQVSLRGIGLSADKQDYDAGFGFGPSAITLERMEIKAGDEPAVVIQQASVEEALSRGSRGLDQTIAYRIGEVSAKGQALRNLTLAFSLRNLGAGGELQGNPRQQRHAGGILRRHDRRPAAGTAGAWPAVAGTQTHPGPRRVRLRDRPRLGPPVRRARPAIAERRSLHPGCDDHQHARLAQGRSRYRQGSGARHRRAGRAEQPV